MRGPALLLFAALALVGAGCAADVVPLAPNAGEHASTAAGRTLRVSPTGDETADGRSSPVRTLTRALALARDGDTISLAEGEYTAGVQVSDRKDLTIRGNGKVVLDGSKAEQQDGLLLFNTRGLTLEGLTVEHCRRNGVYAEGGSGLTVRRCELRDNGKTGLLTAYVSDVLVEECTAAGNQAEHGVYLSCSGDRYRVLRNRLFDNGKSGLQINAVDQEEYKPSDPTHDRLSTGCVVEGNTIYGNNHSEGSAINLAGVVKSTFANNLLHGNHGGGIALWDDGYGAAFASRDNTFVHNTVVFPSGTGKFALKVGKGCTGNSLRNNILGCGDGTALVAQAPVSSDYNWFTGPSAANDDALDVWQKDSGNDRHSQQGDPGLTSEFHLKPGSRARRAGAAGAHAADLLGHRRPASAPDLGCFQDD